MAKHVALGSFDLDDIGPHIGKQLGRHGTHADAGAINDPHPIKGSAHRSASPAALPPRRSSAAGIYNVLSRCLKSGCFSR
jgi:hypothetical protein